MDKDVDRAARDAFVRGLRKSELHVHIEGSVRPDMLYDIARSRLGQKSPSRADVQRLYKQDGFSDFLDHYKQIVRYLTNEEDFGLITGDLLSRLADQNVRYVELTFAPSVLEQFCGIDYDRLLHHTLAAIECAERDLGIRSYLIIDLVRNMGADNARRMVDYAANSMDRRVVGITLGGDERAFPAAGFAEAFRLARDKGLGLSAHAGEAAGPESVWQCIDQLGVARIGHGTSAVCDPALVKRLADLRVHVECCITSNLLTGAVQNVQSHPIRRLFDSGVSVSINTDDPAMFGVSLVSEIDVAMTALGFSESEIEKMQLDTAAARFGACA